MSSSRNSQNLLVNVLRPTYVYDGSSFSSGVVATNIKSIEVDSVRAGIVELGDAGGNVYLGSNAGTVYAASNNNSNNSAFGVNAARDIRNVKNSVFIGSGAGQGLIDACNTVVIGAGSTISGNNNVVVGNNDFITGSNNFILANDVTLTGSYKINVGNLITGDVSAKTLAFQTGISVSGDTVTTGNVGIKYPNPTHALDVSGSIYATRYFYAQDGSQNAPAYTFLSDVSSGIFRDASGSIGFAKGGSYAMKLDPSGNVIYNNLNIEGTLVCTSFKTSGTTTENVITEGYTRNKAIDWTMDLSQGNFYFNGTGQSIVASVSFRDASINAPNGITGTGFSLSSTKLDVSNIVLSGTISNTNSANQNKIGGVFLQASNVRPAPGENHAPSYTFEIDQSLGMYRVDTNSLGFASAGSNRMTISNANVGIGTTTPGARLRVIGDISATAGISGSNITTNGTSSNSIGGILLNSNDISFTGVIWGSTDTTSNKIGGVIIDRGNLRASNGIVGTPSYSFSNETGLGFYSPSTGALSFASGGSDRMTISGGFVGIGTSRPRIALDVSGDISGSGKITLGTGSVSAPAYTFSTDASLGMYRIGANTLGFASAGLNRMTISNANVGIGTTAPTTALVVVGDISGSGDITLADGSVSAPTYTFSTDPSLGMYRISASRLGFATGGSNRMTISDGLVNIPIGPLFVGALPNIFEFTDRAMVVEGNNNIGMYMQKGTNNDFGGISFKTLVSNVLAERMRINANNGFVGIATTAPTSTLTVSGDISASGTLYFPTTAGKKVVLYTANTGAVGGIEVLTNEFRYATDGDGTRHTFGYYTNSTNYVERVRITSNNVGIGTTAPATTLDVSGDISGSRKITLGTGGVSAPTYTFSTDASLGMYRIGANTLGFASAGLNRMTISNANVGIGTATPVTALEVIGDISGANITYTGAITGRTDGNSNRIGGITLSNATLIATTIRNAATGFSVDISSGNINNNATTTSSNFVTPTASSNSIGGVILQSSNINYGGAISNTVTNTSNLIGGITLSNATLIATTIRNAATGFSVDISSGNINNNATTTSSNFVTPSASSNRIGGVTLNANNISNTGNITTGTATSNSVGGVTLSSSRIGIGISAPARLVDLSSSTSSDGIQVWAPNAQVNVRDPAQSHNVQLFQNNNEQGIYTDAATPVHLFQSAGRRLTISGGFVGIGTVTPAYRLDVNGSARITGGLLLSVQSI